MEKNGIERPCISILGCGWFGLPMAEQLVRSGYRVKGSSTSPEKLPVLGAAGIDPYLIDVALENPRLDVRFFESELLIIAIPPKKNTPGLADYPAKIEAIAGAAEQGGIKEVIFISSSGVFGDVNGIVNENTLPLPDSGSGKMMFAAENYLNEKAAFRTTIIRFAGLIGPERNLARHFAGKTDIPNGAAPINLIHLVDCIGLVETIIAKKAFGEIYHGVSPHHPTRADFYTENCRLDGLELPKFSPGRLQWKQVESINVPQLLGYQYQVDDWFAWLKRR